jgi:uncharacterized SAM-binding protein YcdF (DUF218 family)
MRNMAKVPRNRTAELTRKRARALALGTAALIPAWLIVTAIRIAFTGAESAQGPADVAIVLGAATTGDRPSPVFEERIRHGIALYRSGAVDALLFTGGRGDGAPVAESAVARGYALRAGIPAEAILTEEVSQTTQENLAQAHATMEPRGWDSAMIVSDPLHMMRALRMAEDLGIAAAPAPTPTSRYRGFLAKAGFLTRETVFYTLYLITGR